MASLHRLANACLTAAGTFCLLFFVYNLIYHGWALHYVSILLLGSVFFAALSLPNTAKINLALLVLSSVVGLYGAEALLGRVILSSTRFAINDWLNFPEDANSSVAVHRIKQGKASKATFDTRTRLQVVNDLRHEGIRAFPDVFPAVLFQSNGQKVIRSVFTLDNEEFLPLASIANVTTVFCNESGEYIIYRSDEHGFHNPPGLWSAGQADIVALGDSYAHGACVPSDLGFVSLIRERYPATVNLGVNGAGPLAMLAALKEYASILRPRVVLWFYYEGNDLRDLDGREKYSPLLRRYVTSAFSQRLIKRQDEIDRVLTEYLEREMASQASSFDGERFIKLHHLRSSINSVINRRSGRDGIQVELLDYLKNVGAPAERNDLELFAEVLREAKQTISSWGGAMYFVYLPTWERYKLSDLASSDRDNVLNIVNDLQIPIIDVHSSFTRHSDPLSLFPLRRYAHYNEEGHRVVAEEVLRHLSVVNEVRRDKAVNHRRSEFTRIHKSEDHVRERE